MRRFSIRGLIALIVASAISLAALRSANEVWAGLTLLSALTAVGLAILGAALMRGRERAWSLGFAVFGGGYLVASLCPVASELPLTQVLRHVRSMVVPRVRPVAINSASISPNSSASMANAARPYSLGWRFLLPGAADPPAFHRVGHSLFAIMAGLMGGTVAVWFDERRERSRSDAESLVEPDRPARDHAGTWKG